MGFEVWGRKITEDPPSLPVEDIEGVAQGWLEIDPKYQANGSPKGDRKAGLGEHAVSLEILPSGLGSTIWTWIRSVLEATTLGQGTSQSVQIV